MPSVTSTPAGCWLGGGRSHAHRVGDGCGGSGGVRAQRPRRRGDSAFGSWQPSTPLMTWLPQPVPMGCDARWAQPACWDNAGAESLWSTFKHEYYYRHTFRTKMELIAAVDNWM